MGNYDAVDLSFSWNGDYLIGEDGDLEDTSYDTIQSLIELQHDIAASSFKDWKIRPNWASNLDDFIGEPNIRSTAEAIHDRYKLALISSGIATEEDLQVKVIPVDVHRVLILTKIRAASSPTNSLNDQVLVTQLVFDFLEQGISFIYKVPEL